MTSSSILRGGLAVLALHTASMSAAMAQDVTWTGAAAAGPYWDQPDNWTGPWGGEWEYGINQIPLSGKGVLGTADTILRTGTFSGSWQGSGTLTISGGELMMTGDSSLGTLVLQQGGTLRAPPATWQAPTFTGRLDVQDLLWQGGLLGGYKFNAYAAKATLGGGLLGGGGKLILTGDSAWQAGDAILTLDDQSELRIAAGATLRDDTAGTRSIARVPYVYVNSAYYGDYMKVTNEGTYLKSAGSTSINTAVFTNTGLIKVTGGDLSVRSQVLYRNDDPGVLQAGRLEVSGGQLTLTAVGGIQTGAVDVNGGRLSFSGEVGSTAAWQIGAGGTVQVVRGWNNVGGSANLRQATVHNDGLLQVVDGSTLLLPQHLSGQGVVELAGGILKVAANGQVIDGSLRMLPSQSGTDTFAPELIFTIADTTDLPLLVLGGTAELDGVLVGSFAGAVAPGSYLLLQAAGGITGEFDEVELLCGGSACSMQGLSWAVAYGGGQAVLSITAVPEPGVLVLTALGLGLVALRRRGVAVG